MPLLARMRRAPLWLALVVGFAAFALSVLALVPHQEGPNEDIDCLVCKASQPHTSPTTVFAAEQPPAIVSYTFGDLTSQTWEAFAEAGSPRAPPA